MSLKLLNKRMFLTFLVILIGVAITLFVVVTHKVELYENVSIESSTFKCEIQMEHIYRALLGYAHDDPNLLFPSSTDGLNILVQKKFLDAKNLRCPLADLRHLFLGYYWRTKVTVPNDYCYAPGAGLGVEKIPKVVCWDKPENHDIYGKINVLFSDGQIRKFSPTDLEKQIQNYLASLKNDLGISYIYFRLQGRRSYSIPECIIYSDQRQDFPIISNPAWLIKVNNEELRKIGEALLERLFKNDSEKVDSNNKYLVVIFYKDGRQQYRRLSETIPDKRLKQDILKEIPLKEQWVLKEVFENLNSPRSMQK